MGERCLSGLAVKPSGLLEGLCDVDPKGDKGEHSQIVKSMTDEGLLEHVNTAIGPKEPPGP